MKNKISILIFLITIFIGSSSAAGQTTAFTYQGRLTDGSDQTPTDNYSMQFALFTAAAGGAQIGSTVTRNPVAVAAGIFTVELDFGSAIETSAEKYLEIRVFNRATSGFAPLSPRQRLTSAPLAVRARSAVEANTAVNADFAAQADVALEAVNSASLGNIAASQYVKTGDARLNNILNQTATAQAANFNISGNGAAANLTAAGTISGGVVNTATDFRINNNRVLLAEPDTAFTSGNTFVGNLAGRDASAARANTYVGSQAGKLAAEGDFNTFVGALSGSNLFRGASNSFFGALSGRLTNGNSNETGKNNSFFGFSAGSQNTLGANNTFIGAYAGNANVAQNNNTAIGANAAVGSDTGGEVTNSTAVGANAFVKTNNSLVLGSVAGFNGANVTVNVGIGTTQPGARLHVSGGDVYVSTIGAGIIMRSPNGTCFRLKVSNEGALSTESVSCP